jgi:class 3 adenylate cyclase
LDVGLEMQFWGSEAFVRKDLERTAPSVAGNPVAVRSWGSYLRAAASPGSAFAMQQQWWETEVRDVLPTVRTPTLILTRPESAFAVAVQPFVAELETGLPDVRVVELPGRDFNYWYGDRAAFVAELEEFFTGARSSAIDERRGLATVLFTDIVGSTARSAELGDHAWEEVRARHDAIVRRELGQHRGIEIKTLGDGFLATFDGPARAVRCAREIADDVHDLGIEIRAGCHTGEIELADDGIRGIAVHIAARVMAAAGTSEVFVSSTVKDLVGGSGLSFEERGTHTLKGVPGEWRLFAAIHEPATSG